jgi:hypothetical protein
MAWELTARHRLAYIGSITLRAALRAALRALQAAFAGIGWHCG